HGLDLFGATADRHRHEVSGGYPLRLCLATPEPVLPLFAGPAAARLEDGTGQAHESGPSLALVARLGAFTGGAEEQAAAAPACGRATPGMERIRRRAGLGPSTSVLDQPRRLQRGGHRSSPPSANRIPSLGACSQTRIHLSI